MEVRPDNDTAAGRIRAFDVIRGGAVISMVLFHLCYDLKFLVHAPLSWFAPPLQDIWRASISWTFLFVAGCMCAWSRNNLRRAASYLAAAVAIFVVTSLAAVDASISFGIMYCMGMSTLLVGILERHGIVLHTPHAALILFCSFLICLHLPQGYLGWHHMRLALPSILYETPWLSWLGFPGQGFVSGDYYPLLPYTLMYLAGVAMGHRWHSQGLPTMFARLHVELLEWPGRHALLIYLLHQPILLVFVMLLK